MAEGYLIESLLVIDELNEIPQHEELPKLGQMGDSLAEYTTLCQERQKLIKEDIAALIASKSDEAESLNSNADKNIDAAINSVAEKMQDTKQRQRNMLTELDSLKTELKEQEEMANKVIDMRGEVKDTANKSVPKRRNDVSLYTNISNIRWYFDSEPHEVKGFVANKKDVQPFCLSRHQNSQFFIVNYLWDLMKEDAA